MSDNQSERINAVERAVRVSDQSCTAYAFLRDRYRKWAFWLDAAILLLSGWLSAMVFVKPEIAKILTPSNLSSELWIGLLSIVAFSFSLLQLLVNWKGKAEIYHQAATTLSSFVKEQRPLLKSLSEDQAGLVLARYTVVTDGLEPIPERHFLSLKKRHLVKKEISKLMDDHPGANLWVESARIFLRDNFRTSSAGSKDKGKENGQT